MHQFVNQKRRNTKTQGFTLIELMVGVAIVGILAAFAVPMFNNYMVRARISEAVNYANGCKIGWADHVNLNGDLPTTLDQINCESFESENIAQVVIAGRLRGIRVDLQGTPPFPNEVADGFIYLQPLSAQGVTEADNTLAAAGETIVGWRCSFAGQGFDLSAEALNVASSFLPSACRNLPVEP